MNEEDSKLFGITCAKEDFVSILKYIYKKGSDLIEDM